MRVGRQTGSQADGPAARQIDLGRRADAGPLSEDDSSPYGKLRT